MQCNSALTTIQWLSVDYRNYDIRWIVIYPVDSVIYSVINWARLASQSSLSIEAPVCKKY